MKSSFDRPKSLFITFWKREESRVKRDYTSFVVKITGWRSLMSKAGMTM